MMCRRYTQFQLQRAIDRIEAMTKERGTTIDERVNNIMIDTQNEKRKLQDFIIRSRIRRGERFDQPT